MTSTYDHESLIARAMKLEVGSGMWPSLEAEDMTSFPLDILKNYPEPLQARNFCMSGVLSAQVKLLYFMILLCVMILQWM